MGRLTKGYDLGDEACLLPILLTFAFHNFSCLSATSWSQTQRKFVHHALSVTSRMVIGHRSIPKNSFLYYIMKYQSQFNVHLFPSARAISLLLPSASIVTSYIDSV